MNRSYKEFSEHVIETYASLLSDDIEFIEKDNMLKTISASSFSISIRNGNEVASFEEIIDQYNSRCNYQLAIDIIRDSPTWERDLMLVINDILNSYSVDTILLDHGEIVMLQRKENKLYIDIDRIDYYLFNILSQPWELKNLN
ncbi:hypothetical protein [Entomomonas asaccharolytica]|uniref:hypothetical protein n=1 Tax=Entomomonas asaccharolytica TaxID=2785331 RepID=UPI003628009A